MSACSAVVMNALKRVASVPQQIKLLTKDVVQSINRLDRDFLFDDASSTQRMSLHETLIALSVSSTVNPTAGAALEVLTFLLAASSTPQPESTSTRSLSSTSLASFSLDFLIASCCSIFESHHLGDLR